MATPDPDTCILHVLYYTGLTPDAREEYLNIQSSVPATHSDLVAAATAVVKARSQQPLPKSGIRVAIGANVWMPDRSLLLATGKISTPHAFATMMAERDTVKTKYTTVLMEYYVSIKH